ncbi:MAG TPA: CRISPR-associated protein Cas5 [Isosphaeraceae bacterium]|jgi:CRISPR-associated protein Cas5d
MRNYQVQMEVSGPTAIWTRPDSGDAPTSYPAPTFSAVKGIFESVLWLQTAEVVPVRAEICSPLLYHTYTTNYGGPLRKSEQIRRGDNYQLIATVLVNVCYRLYADVISFRNPLKQMSNRGRYWARMNGAHAYQSMFEKRLRRGQWYRTPCLGWQEFVPDYLGPFRNETRVQDDLSFVLPSMVETVFPQQNEPVRRPRFRQNVRIEKGVLVYAP